jgi:hypothetical protein
VVGSPLQVQQKDSPTEQDIEEVLEKYIQNLITLYETNKAKFGYADKKLIVM